MVVFLHEWFQKINNLIINKNNSKYSAYFNYSEEVRTGQMLRSRRAKLNSLPLVEYSMGNIEVIGNDDDNDEVIDEVEKKRFKLWFRVLSQNTLKMVESFDTHEMAAKCAEDITKKMEIDQILNHTFGRVPITHYSFFIRDEKCELVYELLVGDMGRKFFNYNDFSICFNKLDAIYKRQGKKGQLGVKISPCNIYSFHDLVLGLDEDDIPSLEEPSED